MRVRGQLFGFFSFDVGYEIRLDRARALTTSPESGSIERRRAAPAHLAYATPPLRVPLGRRDVVLGNATASAAASATIHDFGAMTIALRIALDRDLEELPSLAAGLVGKGALEDAARTLLDDLFRRIEPAVVRPDLNPFVEDYYVIQLDPDGLPPIGELLARHATTLASILRCEAHALSDEETRSALANGFSYYPDDFVATDWNVALVVDRDYVDALTVLEFLNVQLVELRYYDARLDALVAAFFGLSARPRRWPLTYRPYRRTVQELGAIRLDVAMIVERVHNALKLSGSLYLAKIYTRTAERLGLRAWEESVARKLEVLQEIYDVALQRTATARAEVLELTIIVLIALEIALFLAGWP